MNELLVPQRQGAPVTVARVHHGLARLSCGHVIPNDRQLARHARTACLLCVPTPTPWAPPTIRKPRPPTPMPASHPARQGPPAVPVHVFPAVIARHRHTRAITLELACGHRKFANRAERHLRRSQTTFCRVCQRRARAHGERAFAGAWGDTWQLACGHEVPAPFEDEARTVRGTLVAVCTHCEPGADWDEPSFPDFVKPAYLTAILHWHRTKPVRAARTPGYTA